MSVSYADLYLRFFCLLKPTPWNRVTEKLPFSILVNKFPEFYGSKEFTIILIGE